MMAVFIAHAKNTGIFRVMLAKTTPVLVFVGWFFVCRECTPCQDIPHLNSWSKVKQHLEAFNFYRRASAGEAAQMTEVIVGTELQLKCSDSDQK